MDLTLSDEVLGLRERLVAFLDEHVYPVEAEALAATDAEVGPGVPFAGIVAELRDRARAAGLWNLFLPPEVEGGPGLRQLEYGALCEPLGRSLLAPAVFNCHAPDTGNMELLAEAGTDGQRERWLRPLLEGEIRSCFSMTEPHTAGSDPTGLVTRAVRDGDEWVVNGRKWFTTGANGAALAIAMVVTDPDAAPHARASMLLIPTDAPGFELVRNISVMGHDRGPGHGEIAYTDCRVPADALLGERGQGFKLAQDRLGPGRIHHCMRALGAAERAFELLCARANQRELFGEALADKQFVQDFVARSRVEIDSARLLVQRAAWTLDTYGKRAARQELSIAKVAAPQVCLDVLDRAIQVFGAAGVSDDTPLAYLWRESRALRLVDGADEVHKMAIARRELREHPAATLA